MSQWQCQFEGEATEAMSYRDLVDLVRQGKVTERVRVRRVGSGAWQAAWTVVGLFESAGVTRNQGEAEPVRAVAAKAARVAAPSAPAFVPLPAPARPARAGIDWRAPAAIFAVTLFVLLFYRFASWRSLTFPPSRDEPLGTCYFPLVGVCTALECCLLYLNLTVAAALVAWLCARLIPTPASRD